MPTALLHSNPFPMIAKYIYMYFLLERTWVKTFQTCIVTVKNPSSNGCESKFIEGKFKTLVIFDGLNFISFYYSLITLLFLKTWGNCTPLFDECSSVQYTTFTWSNSRELLQKDIIMQHNLFIIFQDFYAFGFKLSKCKSMMFCCFGCPWHNSFKVPWSTWCMLWWPKFANNVKYRDFSLPRQRSRV